MKKELRVEVRNEVRNETLELAQMLRKGLAPEFVVETLQMELAQVLAIAEKIKSQN